MDIAEIDIGMTEIETATLSLKPRAEQAEDSRVFDIVSKFGENVGRASYVASGLQIKSFGGNGTVGVEIVIDENFRGKGYGEEALRGMTAYAFHVLHLDALSAAVSRGDKPAERMLLKCGFSRQKGQKGAGKDRLFAITCDDYGVIYKS